MAKKRKKLTEEQLVKRRDAAFRKKIRTTFTNAGFIYLNTLNKHQKIGSRVIEVDAVFLYENVMLICEDTGAAAKDKDHIRKKKEAFVEINRNFPEFFNWLSTTFPENEEKLKSYKVDRYIVFNLYISQNELNLTRDERSLFDNILFIEPQTLNYFNRITQCIKLSSRFEIFRFLGIKNDDIGSSKSDADIKSIKAPIICSEDSVGIYNGVRVISFMMSADLLLNTSYVMRKDNWEDSNWPYQRLIEKEKVASIRRFLAENGQAFYNNIIVGLPNTVRFVDASNNYISIDKIGDLENCKLSIPAEWNSICVIDGQHRIFAHYEGPDNDKFEKKIAPLRKKLHLLVTGLIFPENMSKIEIAQIQSKIFLEINSNAKSVPADVLLHIEMISNPFSDIGLARRVIERLNKEQVFLNMFELSSIDESKIKVASIIKFALRYLVTLIPSGGKDSFFTYWDENKKGLLLKKEETSLNEYIEFCADNLRIYFSAIKKRFTNDWHDNSSKILSVTSINGFIIAYTRQLAVNGVQSFEFFDRAFQKLNVDFSKDNFPFTSSQYRKFSDQIIKEAFGLEPNTQEDSTF
ncbi:DGQHR domain-containing protein [Gorillibacterium timonense]|uniref:DGQHR domain-containing protein n=1 Tax=Gorillibacterium timonense TaxID=1689269 RepID=UPI00071D4BFF|nr:DGQHR domain-containing protein [Gorillibacterium timonense]